MTTPNTLLTLTSPQLHHLHSGKVRDSFRVDPTTRLIVTTDRISAFDRVLNNAIPNKGAILTGLAAAWFDKTRHIIDNHFIEAIDPNVMLVKEAEPLRVEVIVRGFLTGSIWRRYEKGERNFSGVTVPDGLEKDSKFPKPIITPTTKDIVDIPITPKSIVGKGLVSEKIWKQIETTATELFAFGTELCEQKGLTLVDTKYEFGLIKGKLVLIDEIHTPDSSRFWETGKLGEWMDKEYIRQWLLKHGDEGIETLPDDVVEEAVRRYSVVYEKLLDCPAPNCTVDPHKRICDSLVAKGLIKEGYVAIICASPKDADHVQKIAKALEPYDIFVDLRMVSAHKNGERILGMADEYNSSAEPGCAIAIAGRSNGLGGALAANFAIPVINCPPFKDDADFMVNIGSSLIMPSAAPAGTCVGPTLAAQLALRCLNLPRLKQVFRTEIAAVKQELEYHDQQLRQRTLEGVTT